MIPNINQKTDMPSIDDNQENFTKNGKCSRCGGCCTHHLAITPTEKEQIKNYIQAHNIKPYLHKNKKGKSIDFLCPFLDLNENTCTCIIYPVRPLICQVFQCNYSDADIMTKTTELLKQNPDLKKDFENAQDCNLGITFFPETYKPKINDYVVFNQINQILYTTYQNQIFQVTHINYKKQTAQLICMTNMTKKLTDCPIELLIKIQ